MIDARTQTAIMITIARAGDITVAELAAKVTPGPRSGTLRKGLNIVLKEMRDRGVKLERGAARLCTVTGEKSQTWRIKQ